MRKHGNRFQSRIMIDGILRSLGTFDTPTDAYKVYMKAVQENDNI